MNVNLKEVLLTGQIGTFNRATQIEEVRTQLGDPNDVSRSSKKYKNPVWKYGYCQIYFFNGLLDHISFYFDEPGLDEQAPIKLDSDFPLFSLTYEKLSSFLESENIASHMDYERESSKTYRVGEFTSISFFEDVLSSVVITPADAP